MTAEELLKEIKGTLSKNKVHALATIASRCNSHFVQLTDLSFYSDKPVAFRASWILEHAVYENPEIFMSSVSYFISKYPLQENDSCRRHFTKILMWILKQRKSYEELNNFNWEQVIESTFVWLADVNGAVAVVVNCMDIIFDLRDQDDWIEDELKSQIEFLMKNGTSAIQSRGKKVLNKLNAK